MSNLRRVLLTATTISVLSILSFVGAQVAGDRTLGFITIESNGTITPSTAPIQRVGNIYTLTNNISDCIIEVQRSNIIVDGAGFTIQGFTVTQDIITGLYPYGAGVRLSNVNNVTVQNFNINTFLFGIEVNYGTNNLITRNLISCPTCIKLVYSIGNQIMNNTMINGQYDYGVEGMASNTKITNNTFRDYTGVDLLASFNNTVSNNTFIDNKFAVIISGRANTVKDNIFSGSENQIFVNNFFKVWTATNILAYPENLASSAVCIVTVFGDNPTGNVSWSTNSTTGLFSSTVTPLNSGTSSTTYTDTNTANITITATYNGDLNNMPSDANCTLTLTFQSPTPSQTPVPTATPSSTQTPPIPEFPLIIFILVLVITITPTALIFREKHNTAKINKHS